MKKIFTLCITLLGLTCMTPALAQTSASDSIPADTVPTDSIPTDTIPTDTIPTDTIPAPVVPVGVNEINPEMRYLLYNVGAQAYLNSNGEFNADHFLMSSHYTMTKNTEVPSAAGPMENTLYSLSSSRPVMVAPDYLGYGISASEVHPYVAPDVITTPAYPMDGRMYDVLGRRIRTSVNGQIYIVNGEKHIRQ